MTERERIPMLDIDEARRRATERGIPEQMADLSVFRIALHQPGVAAALNGMLHELLWNGVLDARLRELIIMRIGWSTGSVYEWTQHWRVARLLDVPEQDLLAVRDWEHADHFGPAERAVLAATPPPFGPDVPPQPSKSRVTLKRHPDGVTIHVPSVGEWDSDKSLMLVGFALAVLGFNLLGDGLRDALDPRSRGI